jgi:hypothetical protein
MEMAALTNGQLPLFGFPFCRQPLGPRVYQSALTVSVNHKGVIDVDTIKGCTLGVNAHPDGGCYGECYAYKIATRYGIDFKISVRRGLVDVWEHRDRLIAQMLKLEQAWYRIGVMGDPCHDWNHTVNMINVLRKANKTAVVITKHWIPLSDDDISRLLELDVIINTSTSGMDSEEEISHRVSQINRLKRCGVPSVNRVVTCKFGDSAWARACNERQDYLLSLGPVIDNPLRVGKNNARVASGDIVASQRSDSIGGGKTVSVYFAGVHLGHCSTCPEQCGVTFFEKQCGQTREGKLAQKVLFDGLGEVSNSGDVEFLYVKSVLGSGFEKDVAELALEDGIAHRAARKNMQIHSAIILKIDGKFAGFFTFQNNEEQREFCLLQSVIMPKHYTDDLYRRMAEQVLEKNTSNYPAIMTTNPKSKFETPGLFESLGFHTYLKMSGFHYMLNGDPSYSRMKTLAHITMTNVWNSVKGEWLKLKSEWNEHIAAAGEKHGIANPTFATREGCWQGESGFANVVTGRAHNGNASVLDPVACEVILRFFTPKNKGRIYNPFGGGVQFGFVAGACGYEYVASEIRQNQCDANNALCGDFDSVKWIQSDSSIFDPDGMFDLVFACPPYYRVERYLDYDGNPPDGEINSSQTYEDFRNLLFSGYLKALEHLNDNRFFVVMTGDSRDTKGAYHCHEAETEIFFKDNGLSVYNKIVYLEAEFTRLAQAKKTLNTRKFPKREQKIIVAYKGDISKIGKEFPNIGRL